MMGKCLLLVFVFGYESLVIQAQTPEWKASTPTIVHGASSVNLTVGLNGPGKVYYAIYTTKPTTITPESIKNDVIGSGIASLSRRGILTVTNSTASTIEQAGLPDNRQYYIYLIAENNLSQLQEPDKIKYFEITLPKRQIEASYKSKLIPGAVVGYNAYVPEDYYKVINKNFPLLLYLHGTGEKSYPETVVGNLAKAKTYGPPMLIDRGQEFPFVVITPQCSLEDWDTYTQQSGQTSTRKILNGKFIDEIIETIKKLYNIDPSRIYLTGNSMGAAGVYSYLLNYPEKVAAAIPIAGWTDPSQACRLSDIAVWAFHNQSDPVVGAGSHINTIQNINSCVPLPRNKARITLYRYSGHDSWQPTYANTGEGIAPDNIYDWLLRQVKGNVAEDGTNQTPMVYAGNDLNYHTVPSSFILKAIATDYDGFIASYQWTLKSSTLNGVAISTDQITLEGARSSELQPANLSKGDYVFRLTVTDNRMRTSFDEVVVSIGTISATEKSSEKQYVLQNPVTDELCLTNFEEVLIGLEITSIQGKAGNRTSELIDRADHCFDIKNLTPGIYIANVKMQSGELRKIRFVKE